MKGPTAWEIHASKVNASNFQGNRPHVNYQTPQYQAPWARYGPPTTPSPSAPATCNGVVDHQLPSMHGQAAATPQAGWAPEYGYFGHGSVRR